MFATLCTNIVLIVFHLPKLFLVILISAQVVQAHLLIWLSFPLNLVCAVVLPCILPLGTSDHYGFELALKRKLPSVYKTQPRTIWRYDHADFQTANELLETVTGNLSLWMILMWPGKTGRPNLCQSWTTSSQKEPTMTIKELTKSICARNLAYKRAKRTGASQHFLSISVKEMKLSN